MARFIYRRRLNHFEHRPDGITALKITHKGQALECLISSEDFQTVRPFRWCAYSGRKTFYVGTNVRNADVGWTTLKLHRLLLPDTVCVDHRDGNGLNNTRSNIRPATHGQNIANQRRTLGGKSSQFKGVWWHKARGKWEASIMVNGRTIFLGRFTDEFAGARAYNRAALKYFQDFAAINLLPLPVAEKPGDFIPVWQEELAVA